MIKTIKIENFKAHKNLDAIDLTNKQNILIYGENGAGKSSIYEALKICFFKQKLLEEQNLPTDVVQKKAAIKEYFVDLNNTQTNNDFNISINDVNIIGNEENNTLGFKLFMINHNSTIVDNTVNIENLLRKEYVSISLEDLNFENITKLVNIKLKSFIEDITIQIESNGDLKIIDLQKNIEDKRLGKYFNEGKINLVLLLIILTAIRLYSNKEDTNVLVLDDFITSLDMSNRLFLIKCIIEKFGEFQIFIFTHNIYFFNLINYVINDVKYKDTQKWEICNLYETTNTTKIFTKSDRLNIGSTEEKDRGTIKYRFKKLSDEQNTDDSFESLGNDIRKKFERLLYEFSKLVSIGGVEESNKILENIEKNNFMVLDCYKVLKLVDENNMNKEKLKNYKIEDFRMIKDILKDLKLYRKVMMHPLSHSIEYGEINYAKKEIEKSIKLIEIFEKKIKDLIDKKVDGF